jgi:hypothetical protein
MLPPRSTASNPRGANRHRCAHDQQVGANEVSAHSHSLLASTHHCLVGMKWRSSWRR